MSRSTCIGRASLLLATASLAVGCGESTGIRGTGPVQITMQRTPSATAQVIAPLLSMSDAEQVAGSIDLTNVICLKVEITGVHLLPAVQDPNTPDDAAWVRLAVEPQLVDLANLPQVGADPPDDPVVIVFDPAVPAVDYRKLRLITGEANEIFFRQPFTVGPYLYTASDESCIAEDGHSVEVPSGPQSGLKTDVEISVADADPQSVDLLFDDATSIRNAVATGNGRINLTPVLRTRP